MNRNAVQHQEQDNNGSENDIGNLPSTAAAVAYIQRIHAHRTLLWPNDEQGRQHYMRGNKNTSFFLFYSMHAYCSYTFEAARVQLHTEKFFSTTEITALKYI